MYQHIVEHEGVPSVRDIAEWTASSDDARRLLAELHDAHALVLDDRGEISMALPFSATPTPHRVTSGTRSWWANCAWDALAIPAALHADARIESSFHDTGADVTLKISDDALQSTDGHVHFVVPAGAWWRDIVET